MEPWHFAVMLKPFLLLLLFIPGAVIAWWIKWRIPHGAIKRFLLISWKV